MAAGTCAVPTLVVGLLDVVAGWEVSPGSLPVLESAACWDIRHEHLSTRMLFFNKPRKQQMKLDRRNWTGTVTVTMMD